MPYSHRVEPGFGLSPILFVTALAAGLVSFASPCVLPLVPAYLGFITGRSAEELQTTHGRARVRVVTQGVAFVLGLAVIFAVLGASASVLGIIFGLQMLGVLHIPLLSRTARFLDLKPNTQATHAGAFIMGLAFGAGWTPCIGPFLGGLLGLAAQQETVGAGVLLLLVYALGLGVPFLIVGIAVNRSLILIRGFRSHMLTVERVSGALVIGMGVLLFTGGLTLITSALTRVFGNGLAL